MPLQVSRRLLYRVGSVAIIPVAVYNLVVAFSDLDAIAMHTKSLIGGFSLVAMSIGFAVLSVKQPDRMITVCK